MNRYIKLGPINIYYYSICMLIAVLTAYFIIKKEAKKQNVDLEFIVNLVFYCVIFGFLGARCYYVLFNLDYYSQNLVDILKIWNGGLAIHGGLILGFLTLIVYCKKHKQEIFRITDISVVGIIIAQSIGRWGNFFNQEAHGPLATLSALKNQHLPKFIIEGMKINGNYYYPTFLYESLWNILGFLIMLILRRRKRLKVGVLTGFYLMWYSTGRYVIEYFRTDSLMLGDIKVAMLVSIIFFISGLLIIIFKNKGSKFDNLYNKKEQD